MQIECFRRTLSTSSALFSVTMRYINGHLHLQYILTACWGRSCAERNSCSSSPASSVKEAGRYSRVPRSPRVASSSPTPSCAPSTLCPELRGTHGHTPTLSARTAVHTHHTTPISSVHGTILFSRVSPRNVSRLE